MWAVEKWNKSLDDVWTTVWNSIVDRGKQRGTGTQNASPQMKVKQEIVFSEKIKWVFSNSLFEDIRKQSKGKFI